jgi:hypothetical protein
MKDISNRLLRDFAACLQQRLVAQPAGVTEGKSPAEVSGEAAPPGTVATPPQAAPQPAPPAPVQPSAPPVKGISLVFSVVWERIRNLFRRR